MAANYLARLSFVQKWTTTSSPQRSTIFCFGRSGVSRAAPPPRFRPIALRNSGSPTNEPACPTAAKKKGVDVGEATRFAQDLEWDSLTVLNFVAEVEDEFDVLIPVNMQAEIETVGQLADALHKMKG
jgi:acyl carrier protein